MPDVLEFLLSDYRCPHCLSSLRFRWLKSTEIPMIRWKNGVLVDSHELCPVCAGKIKADSHPAVIDDWMWGKRLSPGIVVWVVAMIMDFHPVLMMIGTFLLFAGFFLVLRYTLLELWRRPRYVKFDPAEFEAVKKAYF
jgi:hypothetical protein